MLSSRESRAKNLRVPITKLCFVCRYQCTSFVGGEKTYTLATPEIQDCDRYVVTQNLKQMAIQLRDNEVQAEVVVFVGLPELAHIVALFTSRS
jgi:hypothetical protein